ncbi:MAG: two-component system, chemotaxis family, protein-glutamate methylesterase/glutaminase [Chthoniobacter sp.]|jgi:two-component system chemotaxis response regulator CheB|nr:two-component system, chemotaxis family, protein-glutamate methylesterase/glutaminase [Chthoniobacter sp.]
MPQQSRFSRLEAVAIGASAGGVTALREFFSLLKPTVPMAFFVVLHIGRKSYLDQVLSRRDGPLVSFGNDGEMIEPGHVYIAPPGYHLVATSNLIRLSDAPPRLWSRPSIDILFESVAVNFQTRATGIILTGLLNDGAKGLRRIKEEGGTAIVQDPDEAEQPSMPRSALAATEVDHCLPLAKIVAVLNTPK